MFIGTYEPRLDEKGRLIVPARFREDLANGVVIIKGQERCLYVLPYAQFEAIARPVSAASMLSREAREYQRVLLTSAHPDQLDKQGRLVIPQPLRGYAGLDRDVAVLGVGQRVEIWDSATWHSYLDVQEPRYADLSRDDALPGPLAES
jgi:MraZ protein